MKSSPMRTFLLTGIIIILLLLLHFIPVPVVGSITLRSVNILSDILPEKNKDNEYIPQVKQIAKIPYKEVCAKGITPILDYGYNINSSMSSFYDAIEKAQTSSQPVRIAYFSDSFIEGDIFTAELRDLLQARYGGCGVGWVDCYSATSGFRKTVIEESSGFSPHSIISDKKNINKSLIGINGKYFTTAQMASVSMTGTKYSPFVSKWTVSSIYFKAPFGIHLSAMINGKTVKTFSQPASNSLQKVSIIQPKTHIINWKISNVGGKQGHSTFYGVAQEGANGVTVDNFSFRGFSGVDLRMISANMLHDFQKQRKYDLIIIHFGLNTLSNDNPSYFYAGYKKRMTNTINILKRSLPDVPFLIVSVSDRDDNDNGSMSTIKGVKELVAYQQIMASDTKSGYWNLFNAMGGEGSMRKLVEAKPALANKDYTHINFMGGRKLAHKLFDAINNGVNNNKKRKEYYQK
nr:hypothetical protein [Prevotella sp.]